MERRVALYLAHLNPMTSAHAEIIGELLDAARSVIVMPVVFERDGAEINSRSFPFSYEARREMVESVFGGSVIVRRNYAFCAPFRRYVPPLISPASWEVRRRVLDGVSGGYFTYTGDRAEWLALSLYGLRPVLGRRKGISATAVREGMYCEALGGGAGSWRELVPRSVAEIARRPENWSAIESLARSPDSTVRLLGMKFPR